MGQLKRCLDKSILLVNFGGECIGNDALFFDLYGWKRHAAAMVKDIDFVLVH